MHQTESKPLRSSRTIVWLALLYVAFAATALVWLRLDQQPPTWDDGWYLTNSLVMFDAFTRGGVAAYAKEFFHVLGFKAPLITVLPTPFYLLFGRLWHAAYLVNIASMAVLFAGIYRLGREWWSPRAGLIAVYIAGTMPLLYGLARWYMVEYPLAATVVVAIWLLVESRGLERAPAVVLFGLVCGFGLLLKVSFGVFVLFPFLYTWLRSPRRSRGFALAAVPCLAVALPWYALHLRPTIQFAIASGFGQSTVIYGTGAIFSWHAIETYLRNVARIGTSNYYAVVALLLFGVAVFWPRGRAFWKGIPPLLPLWMLCFLVFLFGGNKDVRFTAAILPALALLLAGVLDCLIERSVRGSVLVCALLAFPLLSMFAVSFGVPWRGAELSYARTYQRGGWPLVEILNTVSANAAFRPGEKKILLVGADRAHFNANNLELETVKARLPFAIETTAHEPSLPELESRLSQSSFFVFKEGGEAESPLLNPHVDELIRRARAGGQFTEIPYGRPLPDGGVARIFKKTVESSRLTSGAFLRAGLEQPAEFEIPFGGMIELAGFGARRDGEWLVVKYRWRAMKTPDRQYWCFTHLLDPQGKIVGFLDHPLLDGNPPLRSWQPGDGALEEMRLRIPAGVSPSQLRLRLGIYDPPSGERLRIGTLTGAAAARFSLTDRETALTLMMDSYE
jgi:4-amino-4-deoxy-L-arabinose transferase-like glycosyltransferase